MEDMEDMWPDSSALELSELMESARRARLRPEECSSGDQRSFRDNLGRFPTGVVLITSLTRRGPVGMAVNSFTSVSLDPPLVSFCPIATSATWEAIREEGSFAVTILRQGHQDVSTLFARRGAEKFGSHSWSHTPGRHPVLADALGWIDATVEHVHPAGDHELVIARATAWSAARPGEPLVFYSGGYRHLATA